MSLKAEHWTFERNCMLHTSMHSPESFASHCTLTDIDLQVLSTGGLMNSVASKIRKQPSGKENGAKVQVAAVSNKEYMDLPSVPANRITRGPGSVASTGYDRYGEQPQYAQQQVWAA